MHFKERIFNLRKALCGKGSVDSFLVTKESSVAYLSGFKGHDALILITGGRNYFITDSRYLEEAKSSVKGFDVVLVKGSTYDTIARLAEKARAKAIGFESMDLPYEVYGRLKKALKRTAGFFPLRGVVECLRQVKDDAEIAAIRRSVKLAKSIYRKISGSIKSGQSEEEIASRIKIELVKSGASSPFDPIVATGHNASRPHAIPGKTRVKRSCLIMIDMGAKLGGYCSDITRTVFFGKVPPRFKKIYDVVRLAQERALKKIAPGVRACDVDTAARDLIKAKGFGGYFGHSLGHGVGLDVHEGPIISGHNSARLEEGMVFTVEPAIYIPRLCGVRIEDMVLVTKNGCEVLTGGLA